MLGEGSLGWRTMLCLVLAAAGHIRFLVAAVLVAFVGFSDSAGAASWSVSPLSALGGVSGPRRVSCPSSAFCVATGYQTIWTSTNPRAGAWTGGLTAGPKLSARYMVDFDSVACASVSTCFAGAPRGGILAFTTTAAAGAKSWRAFDQGSGPGGIACPTTTLCVRAAGPTGVPDIYTSTRPTDRKSWKRRVVRGGWGGWQAVSCPSRRFCVAVDLGGGAATSENPTGGAAAWKWRQVVSRSRSRARYSLSAVGCPSTRLCVAANGSGEIYVKANPARGGRWLSYQLPVSKALKASLTCARGGACVLVDTTGNIFVSRNPLLGAKSWSQSQVAGVRLYGVSCPTSTFCAAVGSGLDYQSGVAVTGNPLG